MILFTVLSAIVLIIVFSVTFIPSAFVFFYSVANKQTEEQKLWLPNQLAHDSDSWHAPHLLNLKKGYDGLINKHDYKVQEMYTV